MKNTIENKIVSLVERFSKHTNGKLLDYSIMYNLRRIEMTLHSWYEKECGDSNAYASRCLERDEETGKPYMVVMPHNGYKSHRYLLRDLEKGAIKRLEGLAKAEGLCYYLQTDPRGCALYIAKAGTKLEGNNYSTEGFSVC